MVKWIEPVNGLLTCEKTSWKNSNWLMFSNNQPNDQNVLSSYNDFIGKYIFSSIRVL